MERLQSELAQITLERDQAIHRDEMAVQEILRLWEQEGRLTLAHRNYEHMLIPVLHQRNKA
jgi:hypothetical protein